jgi:hypothetical protein
MPEDRQGRGGEPDAVRTGLQEVAAEIEREFPRLTERTCLVLLDVDPGQLQAQWQIAPADLAEATAAFPASATGVRLQLRLWPAGAGHEQPPTALFSPSSPTAGQEGSARLRVDGLGAEYQAELGLTSDDGGWLLLARSNRVRLPRPAAQPAQLPRAANAPATGRVPSRRDLGGTASPPAPGPPLAVDPTLADSGVGLRPVFPNPARDGGRGPSGPFPRVNTGLEPISRGAESTPLPPGRASRADEQTGRDYTLPLFPDQDPNRAVSSPELSRRGREPPRLELHAELLVYGTAEPGSVVRLFGRDLRVGAGGRFFVRHALNGSSLPEALVTDSALLASEGLEPE